MKEKEVNTTLLFMMGGSGNRFGSSLPKQYTMINNKPLFVYILEKLINIEKLNNIIVITNPIYMNLTLEWINKLKKDKIKGVIAGGNGRSKDILSGLEIAKDFTLDDDVVLMYDATHPFVDQVGVALVIGAIKEYGAATLAEFQYDTTYEIDPTTNVISSVIPREKVIAGASPEGFLFKSIYKIYKETPSDQLNSMTSAGAIAIANGIPMKVIKTELLNLKITYPEDMKLFKLLANKY